MKKTLTILFTIALVAVLSVTLVACANKNKNNGGNTTPAPTSEKGKTYAVANSVSDIKFYWASNEEKTAILGESDENTIRTMLSAYVVAFDNDGNVTLTVPTVGVQKVSYVINNENCVEFYNDGIRTTDDFFGYEYKFNDAKTKITITMNFGEDAESFARITVSQR